jgi:hypothetical protein
MVPGRANQEFTLTSSQTNWISPVHRIFTFVEKGRRCKPDKEWDQRLLHTQVGVTDHALDNRSWNCPDWDNWIKHSFDRNPLQFWNTSGTMIKSITWW